MKKVTAKDAYVLYQKFFDDAIKRKVTLVVWQFDAQGKREIHDCTLKSYNIEARTLHLTVYDHPLWVLGEGVVYGYDERSGVIFKTESFGKSDHGISLKIPPELCYLDTPEIHVLKGAFPAGLDRAPWRTRRIDDEEKLFANQREAPRARPATTKYISCQWINDPTTLGEFILFDLSRGGLGFKVDNESLFSKGARIEVVSLEGQKLDEPLLGEVMSVRSLAPSESGWKVGVRFVDADAIEAMVNQVGEKNISN